jgi:hypothetical protein
MALLALLAACSGPIKKPRPPVKPPPPSLTLRQCLAKLDGNQVDRKSVV